MIDISCFSYKSGWKNHSQCVCLSQVCSIEVTTPSELHATKGDTVRLPCTFTSTASPTSKMRVSWSYTPQTGGPALVFFHFLSKAELPKTGQFAGRIKWQGTPARGDVSIYLINATLNDNGTYICDVTNPPDVFGSPKSDTVLTVTPKPTTFRFSDVAVLMAFVLLPSGLITFFLVGRMLCPKKRHNQSKAYRSPIEVTEGQFYSCTKFSISPCSGLFKDSDEEEEYYSMQKMHPREEEYVESQC
uniref:Myelin protein zero-like protein 3 n=1 Tax=Poecilia formosa TaxID=48698 RepID=A0A096LPY1_POEFO